MASFCVSPLQVLSALLLRSIIRLIVQIGNLQAIAQFLCNFSKSVSGTMADILSPARMVIFGTLLTTLNKPMFALSGWVFASFGTVATLYWITAGKTDSSAIVHSVVALMILLCLIVAEAFLKLVLAQRQGRWDLWLQALPC